MKTILAEGKIEYNKLADSYDIGDINIFTMNHEVDEKIYGLKGKQVKLILEVQNGLYTKR